MKIPRIEKILKVEPFKVTAQWTTGEVRIIDFGALFKKWAVDIDNIEGPLLSEKPFMMVQLGDDKTLEWPIMVQHKAFEDDQVVVKMSPLSFDPLVLYRESYLVGNNHLISH